MRFILPAAGEREPAPGANFFCPSHCIVNKCVSLYCQQVRSLLLLLVVASFISAATTAAKPRRVIDEARNTRFLAEHLVHHESNKEYETATFLYHYFHFCSWSFCKLP